VDVVRTIAELGGARPPEDWDGDSLCEWINDPQARWKDMALSEYYGHNIASGFVMLRQGRYKYVYHTPPDADHPCERELYDLRGRLPEIARRLDLLENVLPIQAEQSFASAEAAYAAGRVDALAMLDAERVLLDVRLAAARARADLAIALIDLEMAVAAPLPQGGSS